MYLENNLFNGACLDIRRHSIDTTMVSWVEGKEKRSGQPAMNRSKHAVMGRKTITVLLVGLALVSVRFAEAQLQGKVPRIGFLISSSRASEAARMEGFQDGLRKHGYVEGQNIIIECRYADGKLNRPPNFQPS